MSGIYNQVSTVMVVDLMFIDHELVIKQSSVLTITLQPNLPHITQH